MNKFKVGQKYNVGGIVGHGNVIEITKIVRNTIHYKTLNGDGYEDTFENGSVFSDTLERLYECEENIKYVITQRGNATICRKYVGKTLVDASRAICSPEDTFDFEIGASIAFERILHKPNENDPYIVRCVHDAGISKIKTGDLYTVENDKLSNDGERYIYTKKTDMVYIYGSMSAKFKRVDFWEEFKAGNISVKVDRNTVEKFLEDCEGRYILWENGDYASVFYPFSNSLNADVYLLCKNNKLVITWYEPAGVLTVDKT